MSGKKVRASYRVDWMEPMVRGHAVVRVGRTGMLEMEDEAEQSQRGRDGTRLLTIAEISPLLFFGTYRWMCRFGGGRYREDFRPR